MGYYSNTTIVMNKDDFAEFIKKGLHDSQSDVYRFIKFGEYKRTTIENKEYVVCQWHDVKWYEGDFREIDFVMDYINSLDSFLSYRVGEEHNDVEERFRGDDYALYDCIDFIPSYVDAYGEEIDLNLLLASTKGGTKQ